MRDDSCEAMDNADVREIERLQKNTYDTAQRPYLVGKIRSVAE